MHWSCVHKKPARHLPHLLLLLLCLHICMLQRLLVWLLPSVATENVAGQCRAAHPGSCSSSSDICRCNDLGATSHCPKRANLPGQHSAASRAAAATAASSSHAAAVSAATVSAAAVPVQPPPQQPAAAL